MKAKPVSEEPFVEVFAWHFIRDEAGFRLLGYRTDDQRGRITSGVEMLDLDARRVLTESGRVYRLEGEPNARAADLLVAVLALRGMARPGGLTLVSADEVAEALSAVQNRRLQ